MAENLSTNKKKVYRTLLGIVTSDKCEKTVGVQVESKTIHPQYKKQITRHKHVLAQDDKDCKLGDRVELAKCAPVSNRKVWFVKEILERARVKKSGQAGDDQGKGAKK